jgi:hypothetical protein
MREWEKIAVRMSSRMMERAWKVVELETWVMLRER